MIGIKQVALYEGTIPQSGKQIIEFAGHKLCHRSIKKDKSDLLVHVDTGIIIRSHPMGTERSIVLDDLANNIKKLEHFIDNPTKYNMVTRNNLSSGDIKEPTSVLELLSAPHNISYKDVVNRIINKIKKTFNVSKSVW